MNTKQDFKNEIQRMAREYYNMSCIFFDLDKDLKQQRDEYFDRLLKYTCEFFELKPDVVTSIIKTKEPVMCRSFIIKMLRDLPSLNYSYIEIGNYLGGRDHATIIHSYNKTEAWLLTDRDYRARWHDYQSFLADRM